MNARRTHRFLLARLAAAAIVILLVHGCVDDTAEIASVRMGAGGPDASGYVGPDVCASCHARQTQLWAGSHHDLAMQPATDEFVAGDFDNAEFDHHGIVTKFYRREGGFFTLTDGANGELTEFPVRYTFGIDPLQQYLVEMPGGKLQALSVAWDSRSVEQGGQRWFHVYGDERIDHRDILHWTQPSQNWETMCADCHSTGLVKHYDLDQDSFDTTWADINVSCEACHGPAEQHLTWAKTGGESATKGLNPIFHERRDVTWVLDDKSGNSKRSIPRTTDVEIGACAPCHSRRARIAAAPRPADEFLDGYEPVLIEPPLYHVDGQIRDEVYVYGSFLQSRMYQYGVTCSDCHEPHSLKLRAPGPQVCLQCHSADKFANAAHHLHAADSPGANCIDCHMPTTTYMQVDDRHDHSFRVPRPELSLQFGTPNACQNCHAEKDAQWAIDMLSVRKPDESRLVRHWTDAFVRAQSRPFASRDPLLVLATDNFVPAIIRSTAISEMQLAGDLVGVATIGDAATSADPMIRWAVARALSSAEPHVIAQHGPGLLRDPVRAVRIAAVEALSSVDLELLPIKIYPEFEAALDEYVAAQLVNAERAEAHVNIANLQRKLNRMEQSEQSYRTALRLNPYFVPAYVNLADLYRAQGREQAGEQILRNALKQVPGQSGLQHSLGLFLVRQDRMPEATEQLRLAAESVDAIPRYALAYALAIDAQGQSEVAVEYLETAMTRFPGDQALIAALANIYMRMGNEAAARELAERLQ